MNICLQYRYKLFVDVCVILAVSRKHFDLVAVHVDLQPLTIKLRLEQVLLVQNVKKLQRLFSSEHWLYRLEQHQFILQGSLLVYELFTHFLQAVRQIIEILSIAVVFLQNALALNPELQVLQDDPNDPAHLFGRTDL